MDTDSTIELSVIDDDTTRKLLFSELKDALEALEDARQEIDRLNSRGPRPRLGKIKKLRERIYDLEHDLRDREDELYDALRDCNND